MPLCLQSALQGPDWALLVETGFKEFSPLRFSLIKKNKDHLGGICEAEIKNVRVFINLLYYS